MPPNAGLSMLLPDRTRLWIPLLLLMSVGAVSAFGSQRGVQPLSSGAAQQEQYRINVDVEMVVLHVTVQDRKGLPVSGLTKQEFQVYEDGVPQTIRSFARED